MDAPKQDPLARLAAELERLSQANLALGRAMDALDRGGEDAPALWEAAAAQRRAARQAAEVSARVAALAPDPNS